MKKTPNTKKSGIYSEMENEYRGYCSGCQTISASVEIVQDIDGMMVPLCDKCRRIKGVNNNE